MGSWGVALFFSSPAVLCERQDATVYTILWIWMLILHLLGPGRAFSPRTLLFSPSSSSHHLFFAHILFSTLHKNQNKDITCGEEFYRIFFE